MLKFPNGLGQVMADGGSLRCGIDANQKDHFVLGSGPGYSEICPDCGMKRIDHHAKMAEGF